MKVNRLGMLIKFAAIYLCMNLVVLSAIPLSSEQSSDKNLASSKEDYDEVPGKTSEPSSLDTKPPLVFPEDGDKIASKNETALEILQKNSNVSTTNETETNSANKKSEEKKEENGSQTASDSNDNASKEKDYDEHVEGEKREEDTKTHPVEEDKSSAAKKDKKTVEKDYDEPAAKGEHDDAQEEEQEEEDLSSDDVENIQENQDQGKLEETYGLNSTSINVFEEPTLKGGHIALIFASTFIVLSIVAYVGLIVWRKTLESRYGMRQRLVTEDDYYNNNDVRFFGL